MTQYYAHSGRSDDRNDWQPLEDHLKETADGAARRGRPLRLEAAARLAGLLHDLGKFDTAFDQVLRGENVRFDHSTAGAAVLKRIATPAQRDIAEILGYCILGHHAGLPDKNNPTQACLTRRVETFQDHLDPVWRENLGVDLGPVLAEITARIRRDQALAPFDLSVAVRMIFSCLVDADFRDTEAFYAALEGRQRDRDWPSLPDMLPRLISAFDRKIASFSPDTKLNRLRARILGHVRAQSHMPAGLFTLTVPTGGGKTLASMGFALDHAQAHGHKRIIYAIPFTSIIDQTAAIFRELFGEDTVLEHHSAIDAADDGDRPPQGRDKLRLAMEDWAAPIIVSTNVQLFESLFAARPSRVRKLHNIAGSVIVLDEAQSLPRPLLLPALRMIDTLAAQYDCTIVLCTATQPAFDSVHLRGGLPLAGRELAPDPVALAGNLRRAQVVMGGVLSDDALLTALAGVKQGLMIVNSRAHALALYRAARSAGLDGLVHLSTRQYPAHRREILAQVSKCLKGKQICRVISTSLVEAGIDLDFPCVWRAEAGLDQIVQAAGRCNREGKHAFEQSRVTVFSAPDYPAPAEVQALGRDMHRVSARHEELLSLGAIRDYFDEVYWRRGETALGKYLIDLLAWTPQGTDFAFRTVAEEFRMIDSPMEPVIIAREPTALAAVAKLGIEKVPSGQIARAIQAYTVQVPAKARARLIACGHASFRHPELRGDQFAVLETPSLYHDDSGLWWEDADYLAPEVEMI